MQISGVFRALALSLLAIGFHGGVVNAGEDSTVAGPVIKHSGFSEPTTLKDTLDLLGKLSGSKLKAQVLQKVEDRIQAYLTSTGIPGETAEKNLDALLKTIPLLRKKLLYDDTKYGKYSDLSESDIEHYAESLVHWLPILHSELWFLYFQIAEESITIGGGSWKTHPVGQSHYTAQLHRWLTDKLDKDVPYIAKGFSADNLRENNRGSDVAARMGITLTGGPLNYAQYGLFFLSPTWHPSNLGSATLFLREFCSQINKDDGVFKDKQSDGKQGTLIAFCKAMPKVIKLLSKQLLPLYAGSTALYKDRLKAEAFNSYVEWLKRNLDDMIESLEQMLSESSEWTYEMIHKAESAGPFKYGFVFKDSKWEEPTKSKLPLAINAPTRPECESIRSLLHELPKVSQDHASTGDS